MFRKRGELNGYYFTVAFPQIIDEENDGYILESGLVDSVSFDDETDLYTVFIIENQPNLEIKENIRVLCNSDKRLNSITVSIANTCVNGIALFERAYF